jgi:hypothetical protein
MALVDDITLLITFNDIQNIERTLTKLAWIIGDPEALVHEHVSEVVAYTSFLLAHMPRVDTVVSVVAPRDFERCSSPSEAFLSSTLAEAYVFDGLPPFPSIWPISLRTSSCGTSSHQQKERHGSTKTQFYGCAIAQLRRRTGVARAQQRLPRARRQGGAKAHWSGRRLWRLSAARLGIPSLSATSAGERPPRCAARSIRRLK